MDKNDPLRQLWLAAVLLTRLPLPYLPAAAFEDGPRAVWAYPVVGLLVGLVGAGAGQLSLSLGLPPFGAAALALGAMMLLTGAMHEDGLADVFDGFWGGTSPERRLEIMRDSQIGTYGVLALVMVSLVKVSAVATLLNQNWLALPAAAALSRSLMPVLMHYMPHARNDGLSRSVGTPPARVTMIALALGVIIALLCLGWTAFIALGCAVAVSVCMALLARRKIGGQTGDVLGATQQLGETAILLTCTALI